MPDRLASSLILVIDDQATLGQLIKQVAKRVFPDAEILVATNGLAGLDLAEQYAEALRLVILDVHLPIVDGRTVCAGIRSMTPTVPIIACTFDHAALPVMLDLGCVGAIVKPFSLDELSQQLQRARTAAVAPLSTTGWIAALSAQARAVLAFARDIPGITPVNNSALSEDIVIMPRAVITKMHIQLDEHYQRVSRSRELRQAIRILQEALGDSITPA